MLEVIGSDADDISRRKTNAMYLATLMVMMDLDIRYKEEDHPQKANTFIDHLFGENRTTKRAVERFYSQLQKSPKARILFNKYVEQFMDDAFGATAMRNRIVDLNKHFSRRKQSRVKWHEDTIISNFLSAQDKRERQLKSGQAIEKLTYDPDAPR